MLYLIHSVCWTLCSKLTPFSKCQNTVYMSLKSWRGGFRIGLPNSCDLPLLSPRPMVQTLRCYRVHQGCPTELTRGTMSATAARRCPVGADRLVVVREELGAVWSGEQTRQEAIEPCMRSHPPLPHLEPSPESLDISQLNSWCWSEETYGRLGKLQRSKGFLLNSSGLSGTFHSMQCAPH